MKRSGFKARGSELKRTPFLSKPKQVKPVSDRKRTKAKPSTKKGSALTRNAKGKECTLRLPGCLPGTDTVVFAHYRRFGWGGMGLKPNDLLGCFACAACHDKQERYHTDCTDADLLRAMGETLMQQEQDGIIGAMK